MMNPVIEDIVGSTTEPREALRIVYHNPEMDVNGTAVRVLQIRAHDIVVGVPSDHVKYDFDQLLNRASVWYRPKEGTLKHVSIPRESVELGVYRQQ
jgi:hypothetical protein